METVKYVGKTLPFFEGKRLFDILCRIKNFGIGRIVYRNAFYKRYPEPSYYIITRVQPDMTDPTQASIEPTMRHLAYGRQIFRGEDRGEMPITRTYKADWKLLPRHQQAEFLSRPCQPYKPVSPPEFLTLPPLLRIINKTDESIPFIKRIRYTSLRDRDGTLHKFYNSK